MIIPSTRYIKSYEGIPGKKYRGYRIYKDGKTIVSYRGAIYAGQGYLDNGTRIDELEVELTPSEQNTLIKNMFNVENERTQLNLFGLYTDLYSLGDAFHDTWNAWVCNDWYLMNAKILDEDFTIIGIAPAPPKDRFLDPVAIVCERNDGIRFWCHAERDWIISMRKQMETTYNILIENK